MNWQFTDQHILCEMQSGYEIHLDGGTWFHPKRLKPVSKHCVDFPEHLSLLRSGLQYIKSIGDNRNADIKRTLTSSLLTS